MSRALEANEVRRTRSGRCVIPRLAVWAGQYAQRDADGNVTIGFTSAAAEQHFAKLAEQELHVPVSRVFVGLECPRSHPPWDSCPGMNPLTIYPTLSDNLLPQPHFNLPSTPIFSPPDSECLACAHAAVCHWFCVCMHACVYFGSDQSDVE